ncbi:MAG: PAS domain S-box protein, partial [Pseudomonadota bacterium]
MDPLIHILHLEDDPADAELARARLDEDGLAYRITRVQTREEFDEALGRAGYDIILGDYRLPTYDGMSALRLALERCPDIPFIFVSGTMGEEAAIEGLTEGATDYVLKQKLSRLVPAIKRALQEAENRRARRWAEEALRESEKKYREFVEKANEGVWAIDAAERTTFVNRRMTEMMGYAPEEMLGKTVESFMLDEELPEHRDQMAQRRQGRGGAFERRYRRKDGSEVWTQASATAVMDAKGHFTGAYALFTDITERKRVEEVQAFLAQTGSGSQDEPFFNGLARFLAGSLGMDFVCIDRLEGDGLTARTVVVWHDGHFEDNVTYTLKDTPRGEGVGKTVCCFPAGVCPLFPGDPVLQDLRAESYIGVTLFNHTGEPMGLIAVIGRSPLKNQSLAEATMKMVAVRAAGELERLDAEAALKESEAKYRSMMEAMEDAVYIGSPDFRVEYQNPAMTKRIGRDATGEPCYKAVHGVDEKCSWCIHEKVMGGESIKTETMSPLDRKTCIISHSPIFHSDGSVSKLAIFHDITETKKMAERLDQAQRMEAIGTLAG